MLLERLMLGIWTSEVDNVLKRRRNNVQAVWARPNLALPSR